MACKFCAGLTICDACFRGLVQRRTGAFLLDTAIGAAIAVIVAMVLLGPVIETEEDFRIALACLLWSYWIVRDGLLGGQSLGKVIFGVRVVDRDTLAPASFKACVLRNLPLLIPFGPLVVQSQIVDAGRKGRRWGDDLANTAVVRVTWPLRGGASTSSSTGKTSLRRIPVAIAVVVVGVAASFLYVHNQGHPRGGKIGREVLQLLRAGDPDASYSDLSLHRVSSSNEYSGHIRVTGRQKGWQVISQETGEPRENFPITVYVDPQDNTGLREVVIWDGDTAMTRLTVESDNTTMSMDRSIGGDDSLIRIIDGRR